MNDLEKAQSVKLTPGFMGHLQINLGGKRLTVGVLEYSGMFDKSNVSIAAGQTPE